MLTYKPLSEAEAVKRHELHNHLDVLRGMDFAGMQHIQWIGDYVLESALTSDINEDRSTLPFVIAAMVEGYQNQYSVELPQLHKDLISLYVHQGWDNVFSN